MYAAVLVGSLWLVDWSMMSWSWVHRRWPCLSNTCEVISRCEYWCVLQLYSLSATWARLEQLNSIDRLSLFFTGINESQQQSCMLMPLSVFFSPSTLTLSRWLIIRKYKPGWRRIYQLQVQRPPVSLGFAQKSSTLSFEENSSLKSQCAEMRRSYGWNYDSLLLLHKSHKLKEKFVRPVTWGPPAQVYNNSWDTSPPPPPPLPWPWIG